MELTETVELVERLDRITKENPAILRLAELITEKEVILPKYTDSFVTVKTAAEILGTSVARVGRYVNDKLLPCWYLPGNNDRRFKLSEIQAFMDNCCSRAPFVD